MTTGKKAARPRVLVVDGEPAICSLLTIALSGHSLEVVAAGDEVEALWALRQQPSGFSIALLSVRGVEGPPRTLAALQQVDPELKAVFMTGGMDPTVVTQLLAQGALAVIAKPFKLPELAALLLAHCGLTPDPDQ